MVSLICFWISTIVRILLPIFGCVCELRIRRTQKLASLHCDHNSSVKMPHFSVSGLIAITYKTRYGVILSNLVIYCVVLHGQQRDRFQLFKIVGCRLISKSFKKKIRKKEENKLFSSFPPNLIIIFICGLNVQSVFQTTAN